MFTNPSSPPTVLEAQLKFNYKSESGLKNPDSWIELLCHNSQTWGEVCCEWVGGCVKLAKLAPLFLSLASSIWMARHHYGCIQLARLPGCVARAITSVSLLKQLVSESFSIPHNCGKHGKWRMPTSSPLEANYRGYTWIFWENLTTSVFWICLEFQFLKRKNVFSWSRLWWVL